MGSATIEVEVRIRGTWLMSAAVWTEHLISKVKPDVGNGLLSLACQFSRVETRIGSSPWKRQGRLHLVSMCDDCDCPDGIECGCTHALSVERS